MLAAASDQADAPEAIQMLVKFGANLDTSQRIVSDVGVGLGMGCALHKACCLGRLESCKTLLSLGAQVSGVDEDLWTPLHFAARFNHQAVIPILIDSKADIDAQDSDGWTVRVCMRVIRVCMLMYDDSFHFC